MATPNPGCRKQTIGALLLALGLVACGTDVAQTAVYLPAEKPIALDCTPPAVPPALPSDPALGGGGDVDTEWVLRTDDYGADQGPGIAVAARDGFRLFVNGHLLAESTKSLEPVFVPLTLLPGKNAVSVVVTASAGPPALLALVDELERPYPSDASWTVSAAPSGDWSAADYDGSSWPAATALGTPAEIAGCDPGPGFPSSSSTSWLGGPRTGTAVFRRQIDIQPIGFAAGTTGGGSAEPTHVTTVDELVAALKDEAPRVIVVDEGSLDLHRTGDKVTKTMACPTPCVDDDATTTKNLLGDTETCPVDMVAVERTELRVEVASDKTLVGLGRGAQLYGATLNIGASKNVIVRNVALYGVNPDLIEAGDGITLDGADGIWVDHVTFEQISDGYLDATMGSSNLTMSWVRNEGHNNYACNHRHPRSNELVDTTATIHHSIWRHVLGKAPLVRGANSRVHLFNDVVLDDTSYAVGSGCGAQVLLEGSSFEGVTTATSKQTCEEMPVLGLISAARHDNLYDGARHEADGKPADEPDDPVMPPSYEYEQALDSADTTHFTVPERAGIGSRWYIPLDYP